LSNMRALGTVQSSRFNGSTFNDRIPTLNF
jgi:hypothetical protein